VIAVLGMSGTVISVSASGQPLAALISLRSHKRAARVNKPRPVRASALVFIDIPNPALQLLLIL
jgi:hypothetical protein